MQIRNALTEFLEDIAPTMPGLFSTPYHKGTVIAGDEALLEYELSSPVGIDEFMDILEDDLGLTMLLHFIPSDATPFGQHCCAYNPPDRTPLFKINAVSDGLGRVCRFTVIVYEDLEQMLCRLQENVRLLSGKGCFRYCRPDDEVILDFLRIVH